MLLRPTPLRWFLLGCAFVGCSVAVVHAQLRPTEDPKPAAAAPAPAGEADKAAATPTPAPASATDPNATLEFVRAQLERAQKERAAELQNDLKAAQRANEDLAVRIGTMEQNLERQRAQDATYVRELAHSSLFILGGLGGVVILALGLIIWFQIRASRQQTAALASQAKVLAALPELLPQLALAARENSHPTILSAQSRFHTAVDRVKQQLDEIESLAENAATEAPPAAMATPVPHGANETPAPDSGEAAARTENSAALIHKGHTLIQEGQPGPALAYLERATVLEPANVHAWLKRGVALEKLQRLHEALTAYDTAATLEPNLPVVHLSRAGVLNRLQRFDDALRCYEQALAVQSRGSDASATAA